MITFGLWPASPISPKVAFTQDLMCLLRAVVLEGQVSLHAFCNAMQECQTGLPGEHYSGWVSGIYTDDPSETIN